MKQISSLLLSCLLLLPAGMNAEEDAPKQWTLRDCIDYALEHNITIQRNRISAESAQEDVKTAKADFLPSLSGNISQRVVNRPNSARGTIISGDNITTSESKTSYNGSYGIDANWTVYNGSKRVNTVKQQKLNNRIAELNVDESENSIEESITQLYVQILYSAEAVKVNESTLEVSRKEFERGQELFNVGSIASSDLAQLEAQVSSDNYQLVTSQATLQDYKLQLKQLLELDGDIEMDLYLPQLSDSNVLIPLPEKDDVYNTALSLRPEIEAGKLNVESSDLLDNKKTLYKTIENLWLAANSAQQQYVAASQKLKSTETSYSLVSEQFNVGMKNTVELLTEKNNLLSAQQETLQAKYTAILNAGLLRFYQGEEINLF